MASTPSLRQPRSDKGQIRFSEADLLALRWIAEQYTVRLDVLAMLMQRSQGATRQWLYRMRDAGLVQFGVILAGEPVYVWMVTAGLRMLELPYESLQPAPGRLRHLHLVGTVRLAYERTSTVGWWTSERHLRHQQAQELIGQRGVRPHLPDGVFSANTKDESVLRTRYVEVELTPKSVERTTEIMFEMAHKSGVRWLDYVVAPAADSVVRRAFETVAGEARERGVRITIHSFENLWTILGLNMDSQPLLL